MEGSDGEGDLEDLPAFVLDDEDEEQDAHADFAAGATFAAHYGHDGRDPRTDGARAHVLQEFPPKLNNFAHDVRTATPAQWFFHFFPLNFLADEVLNAINAQDPELHLTLPLFMNYLTARLIISCHVGLPLECF